MMDEKGVLTSYDGSGSRFKLWKVKRYILSLNKVLLMHCTLFVSELIIDNLFQVDENSRETFLFSNLSFLTENVCFYVKEQALIKINLKEKTQK